MLSLDHRHRMMDNTYSVPWVGRGVYAVLFTYVYGLELSIIVIMPAYFE